MGVCYDDAMRQVPRSTPYKPKVVLNMLQVAKVKHFTSSLCLAPRLTVESFWNIWRLMGFMVN